MKKKESPHADALLASILSESGLADLKKGVIFGKPAVLHNGKAIAAAFHEDLVFKLSVPNVEEALKMDGAHLWDPSGKKRPMKAWVVMPSKNSIFFSKLLRQSYENSKL